MKINDLVVKESKIYYLEQIHLDHQYLEEGIGSAIGAGLGKASQWVGKGVGGVVGGAVGMGKQFAKGFGSGYHGAQSAVTGQPSGGRATAGQAGGAAQGSSPNINMTYQGRQVNPSSLSSYNPATATMPGSTVQTSYQQIASQVAKLSSQEKQQLVTVLQQQLNPSATSTTAQTTNTGQTAQTTNTGQTAATGNYNMNFGQTPNPNGINPTNWLNPKTPQVTMNPNLQGRQRG